MMGTEIFNFDASLAEKLTKTRVSFLTAPTVFFNEAIKFFANSKFFYHLYLYKKIMLYVVLQQNILYFVPTIGVWRVFYGTRSAASSGGF